MGRCAAHLFFIFHTAYQMSGGCHIIYLINNLVVNHNSNSGVLELTFNYFLAKISKLSSTVCIASPHLIPQQFKTNSSRMCTHCLTQFYCSVNMQSPLFLCFRALAASAISIRGVIVQWVGEGQLGFFLGRTLLRTKHTKSRTSSH